MRSIHGAQTPSSIVAERQQSTQAPEGKRQRVGRCRRGGGKLLGRYGGPRPSCLCELVKQARGPHGYRLIHQQRLRPRSSKTVPSPPSFPPTADLPLTPCRPNLKPFHGIERLHKEIRSFEHLSNKLTHPVVIPSLTPRAPAADAAGLRRDLPKGGMTLGAFASFRRNTTRRPRRALAAARPSATLRLC